MYPWGLWNSGEGPQKQHFIRGAILNGDQQYMGKFKWDALCVGKAKEICLVRGPFVLLMPPLMSDFDVLLMAKKKQSAVVQLNSRGE